VICAFENAWRLAVPSVFYSSASGDLLAVAQSYFPLHYRNRPSRGMFFTHENIDGSGIVKKLYTKINFGLLAKLIISVRVPRSPRVGIV
jgi:hypothetical protein